jgi:hypothetical protein
VEAVLPAPGWWSVEWWLDDQDHFTTETQRLVGWGHILHRLVDRNNNRVIDEWREVEPLVYCEDSVMPISAANRLNRAKHWSVHPATRITHVDGQIRQDWQEKY